MSEQREKSDIRGTNRTGLEPTDIERVCRLPGIHDGMLRRGCTGNGRALRDWVNVFGEARSYDGGGLISADEYCR